MFTFLRALAPSRPVLMMYTELLLWVLALSVVEHLSMSIGDALLLPVIIHLSFVYLLLAIVFDTVARFINFWYRKKHKRSERYADGATIGVTRLSHALLMFVFILFIVDGFVPIKTLLGSLTIGIAVAGLAFRDAVTNFISGVNIMFSGNFQLGEYVQVGKVKGRIKDMSFTYLQLETDMQNVIFVPNNLVFSQEVINFSKNKSKNIYIGMIVDRAHYRYYQELQTHIATCAHERFGDVITSLQGVNIRVESLDKESMSWLIEYQVSRYDFELETALKNFTADTVVAFLTERESVGGE